MTGTPNAPERPSVWVVDDSPLEAELCRRALSNAHDVRVFAGGGEMLETLSRERLPHVLVLDWHMPELSGVEVCRFVREARDMAELPILILTATGSTDHLLEALAAGANDFVAKPFSEAELKARVSALVSTAELHARLMKAERRLRVEAEFRERFMGMLAHDLRQPLNAIVMSTRALTQSALPEKAENFLAIQSRASARMQRMIAELLDFARSRPESGIPIETQLIDLTAVARTAIEEIQLMNPARPVELEVHGDCRGEWDPDRVAQICSNLLCNALEHATPDSQVEVRLVASDDDVELCVSNRGPAIPEEVLTTLFQPYRRGHAVRSSSGGVGLGLHIVQQIALAHGGTVVARSDGERTRFVVALPRKAQKAAEAAPPSRRD